MMQAITKPRSMPKIPGLRSLLLASMAVSIPSYSIAQVASPAECPADAMPLFSCRLTSKSNFHFCFSQSSHKFTYIDGHRIPSQVQELGVSVSGNSHGDSAVIVGKSKGGKLSIFINTNRYDGLSPVIRLPGSSKFKFCLDNGRVQSYAWNAPHPSRLSIFTLVTLGLASQLTQVPDWPEPSK
jgi:hypothetical protein